jgi:hypothetical protein
MAISAARIHANRMNALRSTGPRTTAGKRRAALNAVKAGLYAKHLVIGALGESQEELASFCRAVIGDLDPRGAVEREVAERIAALLWRLRRPARAETATMAAAIDRLAPDPAVVTGDGVGPAGLLPPDAVPGRMLARVRAELRALPAHVEGHRRALAAVCGEGDVETGAAWAVLDLAADELGWGAMDAPWPALLARLGCPLARLDDIAWSSEQLRGVLGEVACAARRDPDELIGAVAGRLRAAAQAGERRLAELLGEQAALVPLAVATRGRAAAALYADGAVAQSVARAESHLAGELERALDLLWQLQAGRARRGGGEEDQCLP